MGSQWRKLISGIGIAVTILVFLALATAIAVTRGVFPAQTQSNGNAGSVQGSQNLAYPGPGAPLATVTVPAALPYPPPGATSTPRPPDAPYNVIAQRELPQWDQDTLTKRSAAIIYGTVIDVQPARWSTPDGARPQNPFDHQAFIYTPVIIRVTETLKGTQQQEVLIAVPGGTVGKDSMKATPEEQNIFKKGEQVILYLPKGALYLNGVIHGFYERYTITTDGQAKNEDQELPLEELLDSIRIAVRK